ncbi:MAG: hypothetical protein ACR2FG_07670, partial [Marmoricola sp.]
MNTYPERAPSQQPTPVPPKFPELRENDDIQGNILAGFRKDRRSFFFVHLPDQARGRAWLRELVPWLATTRQVATFNAAFSRAKRAAGGDPEDLAAVWVNVALTVEGLRLLASTTLLAA